MYARSTTLGILALATAALTGGSTPNYALSSTGAVQLDAAGREARYGVAPSAVRGRPVLTLALGGASAAGAIHLSLAGGRLPAPGRYPISSWDAMATGASVFHASFMAGTAEHPMGWFEGESGTVTITESGGGRIAGTFEVRARGFLGSDPADEDRRVTVRGRFDAEDDGTAAPIASTEQGGIW